jgi:acetolactate synthase I/II/III large subunit
VFVFNDNAVGQEKHDLVHKKLNPKYADVPEPDFATLAASFGAKGSTFGGLTTSARSIRHWR